MPAKRPVTQLIDYPGVHLFNFVIVHGQNVIHTWVLLEFFPRLPILKEEVAEPYFLEMGLILVVGEDLFDGVSLFRLLVEAHPH